MEHWISRVEATGSLGDIPTFVLAFPSLARFSREISVQSEVMKRPVLELPKGHGLWSMLYLKNDLSDTIF
jgi:hypothetical protein